MKGRLKDKIKIGMAILFAVIASVIIISLVAGRLNTVPIVIVVKDGLDVTKPLDEQKDFFITKEILKSEMEYFGGSVVSSFEELTGQKTMTGLKAGSPILKSSLYEKSGGGNFALGFPKGFTVRALPGASIGLPPMAIGDKINVGLTYKLAKIDADGKTIDYDTSSIVLEGLDVVQIIGPDLYVKVTLQEDVIFEVLKSIGTMYYQLPGQLDENGEVIDEEGNNTVNSKEILEKIQNGEILNTDINLKELLETGLEGVKDGEVVSPKIVEEKKLEEDKNTESAEGGETNE
jgi:hypothetical protein